jgi:exodeoxyribonuclease VII large subunit
MGKNKLKIYTVSRINALIKGVLADNLPGRLIVGGEITDWKVHQSGHCYFSLKDQQAQIPCVMWRSRFEKIKFEPENGMAVLGTGYIDVYEPQGKYQFYVDKLEPEGVGALQIAFEQMVKRLQKQGFFSDAHKQKLPLYPGRIGILTSESGAAVHDIVDSIYNRWPCVKLFLYSVPVQGEGAAEEIAKVIRDIDSRNEELKLDLLIIGRGGGSMEDLWAFNEEVLARAIYNCQVPIISAVGHEVDTTIADMVADARASTPTKAGVVAVPDVREVVSRLDYFRDSLASWMRWKLELCREILKTLLASSVFKSPLGPVVNAAQRLDDLTTELESSAKGLLAQWHQRILRFYQQVIKIEPHRLLAERKITLNDLQNRLRAEVKLVVSKQRILLTAQENRLAGLNPKSVLHRGYSITTSKKNGALVRSPDDVAIGDLLVTELANENLVESEVKKKQNRKK